MPTYEYECEACGHRFEEFQSIKAAALKTCPECKKRKLRRLIGTGAALLFKGSGFYCTDYRSSDYKSRAKADSAKGSDSSSTKSDSSPSPSKDSSSSAKPAKSAKKE